VIALLAVVVAFAVGFAMKYGGLCTYAAAVQIVRERRFERLMAFLAAAAWAALVVVPLAWWWPAELSVSATHDDWAMAVVGGLLLGLGAHFNRGCIFGTFVQLTGGNLTYVATLIGMVAGALAAKYGLVAIAPVKTAPALAAQPGVPAMLWLLVAAIFITSTIWRRGRGSAPRRLRSHPLSSILVALTLGVGGGWLFAAVNGWDFASVLMRAAWQSLSITNAGPSLLAIACTLSMVAGGVAAAVSQNRFAWRAPELLPSLASFAGGSLMGLAAVLLPGGNDGLLLSGVPALAPHAWLGYALMLASMLALLMRLPNDKG